MATLQEIQLELTGLCNATCCYCTWQKRTVGKQHMNRDLALRLLGEAKEMGVKQIRYHGLGESTLHPSLIEIIAAGEAAGFDHSISTNCFVLKGDLARSLSQFQNLSVILAVPWVMKDKYVETCVTNALDYLTAPNLNHRVHVQMVCHEDAQDHYRQCVEAFLKPIEQNDRAYLHLKQPVTWPNDSPNKGFINTELSNHPKVIHDTRATPLSIAKGCTMPDRFLMILASGHVVPCCVGMDDWGLGNVNHVSLREVWESARMLEIRSLWKSADDSIPCGNCKKRTDCIQ